MSWSFDQAQTAMHDAAANQRAAESALRKAVREHAEAERHYRSLLAQALVRLRAEGLAATACSDVARGEPDIAEARYRRDIAAGMVEACRQELFARSSDRRDVARLAEWSQRRELAEGNGTDDSRLSWSRQAA